VESSMNSVERIRHYSELPCENWEGQVAPQNWPAFGSIEFRNVVLRYKVGGKNVLDEVSFKIEGGEFVGVIGRTGAGKSSLLAALFRLTEIEGGEILIDGVNTKKLNLDALRRQIVIVPQDPVLFAGDLKRNLDPFNLKPATELSAALERVGLGAKEGFGLDFKVLENGNNLSVGQRQLVCLARALLNRVPIVVMDEATSNVDSETDERIGLLLEREFAASTVIMIAHRLSTVQNADRILQLEKGRVVRFDSPSRVLQGESVHVASQTA
jgi:ABC-type multidrug transport system fused ATPase/permease subunit